MANSPSGDSVTDRVVRAQYCFRRGDDSLRLAPGRFLVRTNLHLASHPEFQRPWHDLGTSMDPRTGGVDDGLLLHKEITGARGTLVQTWTWIIE